MNKAGKKYLAAVGKALHCPPDAKKHILNNLTADLQDYLQEKPDATYEAICRRFGSPEDFALESISLMDVKVLNAELKANKRANRIIAFVCVITVVIAVCCAVFTWKTYRDAQDLIDGYAATYFDER